MTPNTVLRDSVRLDDACTPPLLVSPDLLLGLAAGDRPVTVPDRTDHVLVATGAGGGTTTVLRSLAAQALARGAQADILDLTHAEHTWAREIPGARHLNDVAEVHDYLMIAAGGLRNDRQESSDGWGGRRVLVIEELAGLVEALRAYWLLTRPETQLQEAPAVEALALLLASGRVCGWTILAGDTGGSLPGPGAVSPREFSTRILGYGSSLLWRRLAPGVPAPEPSARIGRFHVIEGGAATPFQALYLTSAEARAFALAGSGVTNGRGCA
ncbi:cell division protein FtsK [Streptomyces sp. NPDC015125]|uniref:cell division protein FtsK n=1 Tax=Streptomyces sp. NPDC015125 TaxID=3364938 RepID=UPI0037020129